MQKTMLALSIGGLLFFTGCDSDSSSSSSNTASISGVVIDGYWRGAKVCVDRNQNNVCDTDEPSATSQTGGKYTITASQTDVGNYPLAAEGTTETFDEGTRSYLTGNVTLLSPAGMQGIVTPITTMVQTEVKNGSSLADAQTKVSAALGIPVDNPGTDYVADPITTTDGKSVATVAEGIAKELQDSGNNYNQVAQENNVTTGSCNNIAGTYWVGETCKQTYRSDGYALQTWEKNVSIPVVQSGCTATNLNDGTISGSTLTFTMDEDDGAGYTGTNSGTLTFSGGDVNGTFLLEGNQTSDNNASTYQVKTECAVTGISYYALQKADIAGYKMQAGLVNGKQLMQYFYTDGMVLSTDDNEIGKWGIDTNGMQILEWRDSNDTLLYGAKPAVDINVTNLTLNQTAPITIFEKFEDSNGSSCDNIAGDYVIITVCSNTLPSSWTKTVNFNITQSGCSVPEVNGTVSGNVLTFDINESEKAGVGDTHGGYTGTNKSILSFIGNNLNGISALAGSYADGTTTTGECNVTGYK